VNAVLRDWQEPLRHLTLESAYRVDTIVVPLDGGSVSKAALPVARTLAQLERAVLHIVYVGERLLGPRQTLEELGLTAQELHGVVLDQLTGEPAEAILRFSEELPASLIVMCTHTASRRPRASLGSIAEQMLCAAPARIVLVAPDRTEQDWQIRRVLLAHDGTPTSDAATAPAADIARRADAEVIALHVAARKTSRPVEPGSLPAPMYVDQPHHEWPAWANEFVERMMALGAPPAAVNFKLLVTGGQPGSEIAQFARDHDANLVVMAWHGRFNPQRTGALKVVVRRSGCPVLLICAPKKAVKTASSKGELAV
jgi:nucleotide-binding universal stress UspA family protein